MKKSMGTIIERVIDKHGLTESAEVIDYIKSLGFTLILNLYKPPGNDVEVVDKVRD